MALSVSENDNAPVSTVIIDMDEPYVQQILESVFAKYSPAIATSTQDNSQSTRLMHWREYERIDWDAVHCSSDSVFSSAYCFRKGLIRKAQMAFNIRLYTTKHPESVLVRGVPETWVLELDDIDYLDEALMECYEVENEMKDNEGLDPLERAQFILKPSLTGRGAGIHIFDTRARLESLLQKEFESDSEEDEEDEEENEAEQQNGTRSYEAVSQIREWVVQRYISKPLLLEAHGQRKFHIRVYALAAGDLNVYVYRQMLALFAPESYTPSASNLDNQAAHITNTCVQEKNPGFDESKAVDLFWNLQMPPEKRQSIFDQICRILSETFAAVSNESTSFQAWPNCIEQFGFDFLIDEKYCAYMLEANAYPDFKQTGERLKSVVEGFMAASVAVAAEAFLLDKETMSDDARQTIDKDKSDLVQVFTRKIARKW
ncbi:tubulin--tyrosine ligase [Coemansia sp. RSA 2399]|nr:tubulin--tyrosine ligase [Coemansia sp. RSA 2399]KAJ1906088.1 tubulin--tyrosine ligase [Coemansia sp. IMI 209127]